MAIAWIPSVRAALVLSAVGLSIGLTSGCQTSGLGGMDLPVPPNQLDTSSLDHVRFQSPDLTNRGSTDLDSRLRNLSQDNPVLGTPANQDGDRSRRVAKVIFSGNNRIPTHHLTRNLSTRPGRFFDPDRLQQDIDQLWRMPEISRIKGPFLEHTADGVVITLEVVERILISQVEFVGNRGISDRSLAKEAGLAVGDPLDAHQIRMAKSKLENLYKQKGYPKTQVDILDGADQGDTKVTFLIHEDQRQRIWKTDFEGNQIASDARLRHFVESKPGALKMIGGLVNREEIDQDVVRLTNYYRSLGFFGARIGREISESNDGRWLTIRFIINEGPRYRVRQIAFMGNQHFKHKQLEILTELKPNEEGQPEFNVAKMNKDVVSLRDLYGSQGFVFANVEAEPRFLEEPGLLDIVYKIEEGEQYRVGNINVHFKGEYGITKREVVLNRLSCRPGELIDVREIRNSERRLGASQLFAGGGAPGQKPPRIVIRPPEVKELERYAKSPSQSSSGSSTRSSGSSSKYR